MSNGSYHFQLGEFTCICLSDGSYDYPLENFFANAPIDRIEEALRQRGLPVDYITTPYTYLYVDTGTHRLLVDVGAGHLGPRTGTLLQNLRAAGLDPKEVDTVAITHAHPDHVGGALDDAGKPVYANAHYYLLQEEWDFWFSPQALEKTPASFVTVARTALEAVQDRVTLVSHEAEFIPGVRAIPAPGHTPGHMVVQLQSGDQRLYYIGDTVLYPLHLEFPDWTPIYDIVPEQAAASKQAIFDRVAAERALVVGQHFPPFPSLGYVLKEPEGWLWQPVEITP